MKQKSRRSAYISIIVALIIHLLLLVILFLVWQRQEMMVLPRSDAQEEESAIVHTSAGWPGTTVSLYQPPTMTTAAPPDQPQPEPPAVVTPTTPAPLPGLVQQEESPEPTLQEKPQPGEAIATAPAFQETPAAQPVAQRAELPRQQQRKVAKRTTKSKRQAAIETLRGLSFAMHDNDTLHAPSPGNNGYAGSPTDAQAIAYRLYANKVLHTLGVAINTDKVKLMLERDVIRRTTLFVKLNRKGILLDLYFDPCPIELKEIEAAIRCSAYGTGLYPRIPDSLQRESCLIPIPLHVDGKAGSATYGLSYGRF